MMFTDCCKKLSKVRLIIAGLIFACTSGVIYAADNTNAASAFLCEYGMSLYKEGNIDDAIHQLKNALMVNPNNPIAQKFLKKILSEQGLETSQEAPQKEAATKETAPREIQPDKQLIKLEKESRYYQEELDEIIENSLKIFSHQLQSLKQGYHVELSQKEKELEILKSNYEGELRKLNDEMKTRDSEFKEIINKKDSLLEKYRKTKVEQIAKIEDLMRQIEEFLCTVEGPIDKEAYLSKERLDSESEQIAKIEDLMRQIEEVLPKSD